MILIYPLFFFVFGLIIGSFLNVVILRRGSGRSVGGRSFCASCAKTLEWFELVPLLSFVVLRGRCRKCKAKISWQYPIVELATGLLFVMVFMKFQDFSSLSYSFLSVAVAYSLVVWSILLVIFVYDSKHHIIPDNFVYLFVFLSLIFRLGQTSLAHFFSYPNLSDLIAGPLLFLPFFLFWYLSRGKLMGLGDGKLALGMGFMLGFEGSLSAIMIGFWIGAVVSIIRIVISQAAKKKMLPNFLLKTFSKNLTMKSEVAFAPYLILGVAAVYFFGLNVLVL